MPNPLESGPRRGAVGDVTALNRSAALGAHDEGGARVPADEPERSDQRQRNLQFRLAGVGLEFGAGIAGCVLFGYWADRTFGTANKGVIIGAIVGCVGGMYHLVTRAMNLQKKAELDARRSRSGQDIPGPDAKTPGDDS